MNDLEKKNIIQRYNQRFQEFGYDPRTLGWTKGKHKLRFHILLSYWDLAGSTILDFGCGFGDMYDYCITNKLQLDYHGIDINSKLIEEGKSKYPEAKLSVRDVLKEGLDKNYDYIFSSGVHNFKIGDNWKFIEETFKLFNQYSNRGFALNFLSNKVEYELEDTYHSDPAGILNLAYNYSNRVCLRNDYMPFEFTVIVDKQNNFDKAYTVYEDYYGFLDNI